MSSNLIDKRRMINSLEGQVSALESSSPDAYVAFMHDADEDACYISALGTCASISAALYSTMSRLRNDDRDMVNFAIASYLAMRCDFDEVKDILEKAAELAEESEEDNE